MIMNDFQKLMEIMKIVDEEYGKIPLSQLQTKIEENFGTQISSMALEEIGELRRGNYKEGALFEELLKIDEDEKEILLEVLEEKEDKKQDEELQEKDDEKKKVKPYGCDEKNYANLLAYTLLARRIEGGRNAEMNAYKLALMFGDEKNALGYLQGFAKRNNSSQQIVHDACLFSLPEEIGWNTSAWQKIFARDMKEDDFKKSGVIPNAKKIEEILLKERKEAEEAKEEISKKLEELTKEEEILKSELAKERTSNKSEETKEKKERRTDNKSERTSEQSEKNSTEDPLQEKRKRHRELTANIKALTIKLKETEASLVSLENIHPKKLTEIALSIQYPRKDEDVEAAELFQKFGVGELTFNKYLELKPDRKNSDSNIPSLIVLGEDIGCEDWYIIKLHKEDPKGALLGEITACCQSLGKEGNDCVEHGMKSEFGGFYVLCKGKKHEDSREIKSKKDIIAQSWAWRGKDGEFVLDSIESQPNIRDVPGNTLKMMKMFHKLGFTLVEKHGLEQVNVGCGGATPEEAGYGQKVESTALPVGYNQESYRDSEEQRLLCQKAFPIYSLAHFNPTLAIDELMKLTHEERKKYDIALLMNGLIKTADHKQFDRFLQLFKIDDVKKYLIENEVLIKCTQIGNKELIQFCYFNEVDIDQKNSKGQTALQIAVQKGDAETVSELLKWGAEVDQLDSTGNPPIVMAVNSGYKNVVATLLDHGADINVTEKIPSSNRTDTLLILAVPKSNKEVLQLLLERGADFFIARPFTSETDKVGPLTYAFDILPNKESQRILLNAWITKLSKPGTNIDEIDPTEKMTLAEWIAKAKDKELLEQYQVLLMRKAIEKNDDKELLSLLTKHPFLVNSFLKNQDGDEGTLLMYAAELGNIECVKLLIQMNANVNARDKQDGDNVLCWALDCKDKVKMSAIVGELLSANANPLQQNNAKELPIDRAIYNNASIEVIQKLYQAGNETFKSMELAKEKRMQERVPRKSTRQVSEKSNPTGGKTQGESVGESSKKVKQSRLEAKNKTLSKISKRPVKSQDEIEKKEDIEPQSQLEVSKQKLAEKEHELEEKKQGLSALKRELIIAIKRDDAAHVAFLMEKGNSLVHGVNQSTKEEFFLKRIVAELLIESSIKEKAVMLEAKEHELTEKKRVLKEKEQELVAIERELITATEHTEHHDAENVSSLAEKQNLLSQDVNQLTKDKDTLTRDIEELRTESRFLVENTANRKEEWAKFEELIPYEKSLLEQSLIVGEDEGTLLMHAAHQGSLECIKYLASQHANVNARDSDGDNVLCWAIDNEDESSLHQTMLLLKELGADICQQNIADEFPLDRALCEDVSPKTIRLLLPPLDSLTRSNSTVSPRSTGSTGLFLSNSSATLERQQLKDNTQKQRQLLVAIKLNDMETVNKLIISTPRLCNQQIALFENGCTPLMYAAQQGNLECVKLLLDKGADLKAVDEKGNNVLSWALDSKNKKLLPEIIEFLIDKGADPTQQNVKHKTALDKALKKESAGSVIKSLRK